ncbi:uncharacterized protein LOC143228794 isoform X2 [Tachypleus tridentatus]|uniref:uncharacterized protein LOC143228794 isoform X2 n=1 Tax=Tachypleus tridentatus TaxID=6853 RepID=UPI003FCFCAFC
MNSLILFCRIMKIESFDFNRPAMYVVKTLVCVVMFLQVMSCSSNSQVPTDLTSLADLLTQLQSEVMTLRESRHQDQIIIKRLEERVGQLDSSVTSPLTPSSVFSLESPNPEILESPTKPSITLSNDRTNAKRRHRVEASRERETGRNLEREHRVFRKLESQLRQLQQDLAGVVAMKEREVGVTEEAGDLRLETELLRTEIRRLQQDLESLRADRKQEQAPLRASQETNKWLQKTVGQLRVEMRELAESLNVSVSLSRWQTFETNVALLKSDYDALQKETEALRTLQEKNAASVERLWTEIGDLRSHFQKLSENHQHLTEKKNDKNVKRLTLESLLDGSGSGDEKEFFTTYSDPGENNHHFRHHKHLKMEVTMMQQAMKAMEVKLEREVRWLKQNHASINLTVNAVSRRTDFVGNQTTTLNTQQLDLIKQMKESEIRTRTVEQDIRDTKEQLRNVTEMVSVVDKLYSPTLKLFEALEILEDRLDKNIQDLQREVSKSDFNIGQMQSSFEILREDQSDHYGVLKTLKKDYSVLKIEVQRNHYRLLSVQNEVLNQSLQECKANNKELLQDLKLGNLEHKLGRLQTQVTNNHLKVTELDTRVETKIDKSVLSQWAKRQEEMKQQIQNISTNLPQIKSFYSDLKTEISKFVDLLPQDCSMDQDTKPPVQYKSGVYLIHPQGTESAFPIYCDMDTAGGRWTVIQRRNDGSQDFYRPWEDYKQGFGDPSGEYWLGNEAIHQITSSDNYTLRLDMWDTYGRYIFAEYDLFYVENEADNYRLTIGGYHGNATDAMENHNRMAFSTSDRDNDASSTHCAVYYSSGWWYNHCQYVNINGRYNIGLTWYDMDQHEWVQLTRVEMKLRPLKLRDL